MHFAVAYVAFDVGCVLAAVAVMYFDDAVLGFVVNRGMVAF